eukprot:m.9639 g.9639  ORF g.9639 m.9639 type:complete len:81 (+) comp2995_c0_seq1:337-579(+)
MLEEKMLCKSRGEDSLVFSKIFFNKTKPSIEKAVEKYGTIDVISKAVFQTKFMKCASSNRCERHPDHLFQDMDSSFLTRC